MKLYNSGDYRAAIREFSAAQQLVPADLNNYNLALCYDKLGEAEPAVQYYRAFLDRQPNSDKRAEIEASIARLEAALRSSAAKREDEARRAREDEARRAREDEARRARERDDEARRAREDADDADDADDARRAPGPAVGPIGPARGPGPGPGGKGAGSTGTPSSGVAPSTGDAQLDRVQQIDIGAVRDQRMGDGAGAGAAGGGGAGGYDPANPAANVDPRAAAAGLPPPSGAPAPMMPGAPDDKPKEKPVYKKWWFWAVVGVGAYVVYAIATEDSSQPNTRARETLPLGPAAAPAAGGWTLMRW